MSALSSNFFKRWDILGLFFSLFSTFQKVTVNMFIIKSCQSLDSNRVPLIWEATALPTESQPLSSN